MHRVFVATREQLGDDFGPPTNISTNTAEIESFDVSADGLRLYAATNVDELSILRRTSLLEPFGAPESLVSGVSFPSLPSDELTIYYHRDGTLYRMHRDTREQSFRDEMMIASGQDPDISSDGRTLIYYAGGFEVRTCL